jgi:hypothetical protein
VVIVCSGLVLLEVVSLLILYRQNKSPTRIKDDTKSHSKRQAIIQDPLKMLAKMNQGVILWITWLSVNSWVKE